MLPWVKKITKKRTTRILIGLFVVFFCVLFFSNIVQAQTVVENQADVLGVKAIDESDLVLSGQDIRVIVAKIIRAVLGLLGIIAVIIIIYAGYVIMTSAGNEEKVVKGKKILLNAVIGLTIILSALIIVQFILNALADATGLRSDRGRVRVQLDSFAGSGALGRIVKDHYPTRDQTGVYRNTSIIVTFADTVPVDPSSIIKNDNQTCWDLNTLKAKKDCTAEELKNYPYYGDCVDLDGDNIINRKEKVNGKWECDTLLTDSVSITSELSKESLEAFALSSYENVKLVDGQIKADNFSFVFVPRELLGSPEQNVKHKVTLTNDILNKKLDKEDQQGIFSNQFTKYYSWNFETNTELDIDPPYVVSVSPQNDEKIPKNKIIRVQFSEPMNPIMISGKTNGLDHTSFTNILLNTFLSGVTTTVSGDWKVSNGYTSVEFTPETPCGLNSCGDTMYCLPLDCPEDDSYCSRPFEALIRTADLTNNKEIPFEAYPFTGVMDVAFNALDGDNDKKADGKPAPGNFLVIDNTEKSQDNYWWGFDVYNKIDREAPYIVRLTPDIDRYSVAEQADLNFYYSKPMWYYTLNNFSLEEYPEPGVLKRDGKALVDAEIWFYSRMTDLNYNSVTSTMQTIKHRAFGPNDADLYYFPILPSTIMSDTQNCLYPGRGPATRMEGEVELGYSLECKVEYDNQGNYIKSENCVGVNLESDKDTGCMYIINRNSEADNIVSSTEACLEKLKTDRISPYTQD